MVFRLLVLLYTMDLVVILVFKYMSILLSVGIDEVGRGPLAGPVTVCACVTGVDFDKEWFSGIRDSKKLSEKKRLEWFVKAEAARDAGLITWILVSKTAMEIDERGITLVIQEAIEECLKGLMGYKGITSTSMKIFLDGSLHAPACFEHQETIIKGDEKVPLIGIASIIAKVTRDRYMDEMGKKYPEYGFEKHKGYGTEKHYKAIKSLGILPLHRQTFLKNLAV
jgi:ribonuclease HII